MRGPVFDTPVCPPGWDESAIQLIRIVDPAGRAIAWLAPDLGANCVGYAVRAASGPVEEWTHVFHAIPPPRLTAGDPEPYGCEILVTPPHDGSHAHAASPHRGVAHLRRWRFVERDPTAAVLETSFVASATGNEGRAATGGLGLRLVARLDDSALSLELTALNRDAVTSSIRMGLQPSFARGLLGKGPWMVHTHISGQPTRLEVPENGRLPLSASSLNRGMVAGRGPTVYLAGPDQNMRVALTLEAGIRDFVTSTAEDPPVVSLALLSADPIRLPPSGSIRLAASIILQRDDAAADRAASSPMDGDEV